MKDQLYRMSGSQLYECLFGPEKSSGLSRSPETFRAYFGWHSLCIFKTKASWGTKLCRYFYFYSLYNIWKDQLYRISRSWFYEWLFGPEKFSGLSRNGPLARVAQDMVAQTRVHDQKKKSTGCDISQPMVSSNHASSNRPELKFTNSLLCISH